jgi:hypothetical protein
MTKELFKRIFRDGVPPTNHGYPGLGYKVSTENEMIFEHDVAVQMRDGVKIYVDVTRPEGKEKVPAASYLACDQVLTGTVFSVLLRASRNNFLYLVRANGHSVSLRDLPT